MFCCSSASAVQQAWIAKYIHGSNSQAVAIALDKDGNIYVGGHSTRTNVPFDFDYVIIKYNSAGVQQWVSRYGGPGTNDQVRSMVANTNGEVVVTGTSDTVKYLPSGSLAWSAPYAGQDIATDNDGNAYVTGFSTTDFATVKINPSGSNVWLRTWDFSGLDDRAQVVTLDSSGNVFIAGLSTRACDRFGCYTRPYILKYDFEGNLAWAMRWENDQFPHGDYSFGTQFHGFACDAQGNLYLALSAVGWGICCGWNTAKVDTSGEMTWGKIPNFIAGRGVRAMALDPSANVYYTGIGYDGIGEHYHTYKTTAAATNLWDARYPGPSESKHWGQAIAADAAGNAYVTGRSTGDGTGNDYATIKYSPTGQQLWVMRYNEVGNSDDQAHAIAVSPAGEVYVTGFSNPSPGVYEITTIKYIELSPIEKKSNGNMLLTFCGAPGSNYVIQASGTLTNWNDIATVTANSNGLYTYEDTNAPLHSQRFYRALQE